MSAARPAVRLPARAARDGEGSGECGSGEEGSATVEFVFLAVLLLIPLVYVLLAVFSVQRASYGVTAATREAGRAYVTARSDGAGEAAARRAAEVVLADYGLTLAQAPPRLECDRRPCLTPGGLVTVEIAARVPLPFLAGLPGSPPATIGVSARHIEVVDLFRAAP